MKRFVAILGVLAYSSAYAQKPDPDPAVTAMVGRWDKCFDSSTRSQFGKRIDAEPNMVAEIAFQACATEEEALMTYLTPRVFSPNDARAIVLRHRGVLKRKITG